MNHEDLSQIEAQLKADLLAVQRVRELMARGLVPNGDATSVPASGGAPTKVEPQSPVVSTDDTAAFGEVSNSVRAVVKAFNSSKFTIPDVERALKMQGKKVVRASIRGVIGRMERQGKIRVARKGEGRRPTTYYVPEDMTATIFN